MRPLLVFISLVFLGAWIAAFLGISELKRDKAELVSMLDSTIHEFETYRNEAGAEITTQRQVIGSLENAITAKLVTIEELERHNLRSVSQIVRLEALIERLELEATYTDDPEIIYVPVDSVDYDQYLKIPQNFHFKDPWTSFYGIIHAEGVNVSELTLTTKTDIFTGYQRQGFLRRPLPVVIVEYDNPYINTVAMQNITVKEKPPIWNRPNFYRAQGAVAVLLLNFLL